MNIVICLLVLISIGINAYPDEYINNVRDAYNRYDSDWPLNGFFPFWGILLLILSGFFLFIAGLGFIGYLIGFRTPPESHHPSTDSTAPFFVIQNFAMTI